MIVEIACNISMIVEIRGIIGIGKGWSLSSTETSSSRWSERYEVKKTSRGYTNSFRTFTPTRLAVEKDSQSFLFSALKEM